MVKDGSRSWSTFRRLLGLAAPVRRWMALAAFLGFATVASSVALMATAAYLISAAALQPSIAELQVAAVGVRFFGIARGLFRYLERYVAHDLTFKLLARLRVWFYRSLEPLAPARLMAYRSGDLLSRIVTDIETLEGFYLRVVAPPVVAVLIALLNWGLLAPHSPWLGHVAVVFLIAGGGGTAVLVRSLSRGAGRRTVAARAELAGAVVEGMQGLADLVTCDQGPAYLRRVEKLGGDVMREQEKRARIAALGPALCDLSSNLATVAVLAVAIPLVHRGEMEGVYLAVVALTVAASFEAVAQLPTAFEHLDENLGAGDRLFELVDAKPAVAEPVLPSPVPQRFDLSVRELGFTYPGSLVPALDGVSFSLPEGGRLAVVGPSGAGKSTLVHLLLRFWDYDKGSVRLGVEELRAYSGDELRRWISVVSQQTHLFHGTVRDNLLLAAPDASEEDLAAAAERVHLDAFLRSLPDGFDTWIGEQGLALSGGERQRLAIARAILQDAPILILDEATAYLDALTEQAVMAELKALMAGRTTLVITHRLAGLESMDEILVIEAGKVVERGRHQELMAGEGVYRGMYDLQRWTGVVDTALGRPGSL